jgi:hypothetical protein
MEQELTLAIQECLDIQSATPAVIREAEKRGIFPIAI